ncbi:hypothetical protein Tco_0250377 [Tanacetum coccineum]
MWHCPAWHNRPGAIDGYKSLQSHVTHAFNAKGSTRVNIHRDLTELLEQELRVRRALVVLTGELYGKWKGLNEVVKDKEISLYMLEDKQTTYNLYNQGFLTFLKTHVFVRETRMAFQHQ